jgi:hypothetical protein
MADTASSILLQRIQSVGSNVNLWGGYINTDLQILERASKGYQAYTVTGDATISWTNYSATNDYSVAVVKATGSPSAAWTHTLPGYQMFFGYWNASGQTGTLKNSGGTGISVPNNRRALLFGDATDIREASPNWLSSYATTLSNNGDIVVKATLETAIANASLPASAGTVLVSAADTTAGYLGTKITGSGAASVSVTGTPGNGSLVIAVGALGLTATADQNSDFSATAGNIYPVDCSAAAITATLPAATASQGTIGFKKFGTFPLFLSGTVNGESQSFPIVDEGIVIISDVSASRGWV